MLKLTNIEVIDDQVAPQEPAPENFALIVPISRPPPCGGTTAHLAQHHQWGGAVISTTSGAPCGGDQAALAGAAHSETRGGDASCWPRAARAGIPGIVFRLTPKAQRED